jgi:hypothetical protein
MRAVNATPVSTDNCGVPNVTFALEGSFVGSSTGNKTINGVIFLEGVTTVTYISTDPAGNVTTCSFTVTVNCHHHLWQAYLGTQRRIRYQRRHRQAEEGYFAGIQRVVGREW